MLSLYNKKNGQEIVCLYPKNGTSNILTLQKGVKVRSFTGPNGKGVTIRQAGTGEFRNLLDCKVVQKT